jgi:anti-sigma regulatory factor (Ser/Thr protein kinase)
MTDDLHQSHLPATSTSIAMPTHTSPVTSNFSWHTSQWPVAAEVIETVELVVSELVTNALRATPEAEPADLSLGIQCFGDRLRIEVADSSPYPPVRTNATDDMEGGRGLTLVDAVSLRWNYYYRDPDEKVVWREIAL